MTENALNARSSRQAREQFISSSQTFILASAGKICHRLITRSDDEWSVALSAFNEAIDSYDEEKGGFKSFAYTVMKRRLSDESRRQSRHEAEICVEPYVLEGSADEEMTPLQKEVMEKTRSLSADLDGGKAGERSSEEEKSAVLMEIASMQKVLKRYGFSFFDLTQCSPKSQKTRRECACALGVLMDHPELMEKMRRTKCLPLSDILRLRRIPPKILERHRRYLIAAAEIMDGEYPILNGYLREIRKEMRK